MAGSREIRKRGGGQDVRNSRIFSVRELRLQKAGRKVIVAVKLNIVEGGCDAVPAGSGGGFRAANVRHCGHDHISASHGLPDKNNLKLDGSAGGQLPGAKKINAGGTDVAGDESDRKFLGHSADSAETQRESKRGTRVLPVFWMNADGMRGHADEPARLCGAKEGREAQCGHSLRFRNRLWSCRRVAKFGVRFGWPRFEWSCALNGAHLTLRDDTSQSLAKAQQSELQINLSGIAPSTPCGMER